MQNRSSSNSTRRASCLCAAVLGVAFATSGRSQIVEVGPTDPANGYPQWYRDANDLTLGLCLSQTGFCLTEEPDPTQPISFPDNFTGESFYWQSESSMDLPGGGLAILIMALEAAFANEDVIDGDQTVFNRLRIRIDTPSGGTYTVIHPFGVDVFDVPAGGRRSINFTVDFGIDTPGVFTNALQGRITTFLTAAAGTIQDAVGDTYLADPAAESALVGSPFGIDFFRIEGPDIGGPGIDFIETSKFSLMGKLFAGAPPPPPPPPPGNVAPVAVDDTATTNLNTAVTIDVVANDTDADANLAAASVAIASAPALGTAVANGDGTVTYTPNTGAVGTDSFTYTVEDAAGAVSNVATVTVTILGEAITVNKSFYFTSRLEWRLGGTETGGGAGTTITLFVGPTTSGPVIGTATVMAGGAWALRVRNSPVPPDASSTISLRSSLGTEVLAVPLRIRP